MGVLTDITPFKGMGRDEIAEERERLEATGEASILVKAERPAEITEEALTSVAYHEWKRYRHGQLAMVRVERREVPGVLAILKANPGMDVAKAVSDLRAFA